MPQIHTQAFTLRRRRTREADALVTLFTQSSGKVIASTRSVMKTQSRLAGITQPFQCLDVILYAKTRDQEIWTLTQASLIASHARIQSDMTGFAAASLLAEWCESLSAEFDSNQAVYRLLQEAFARLDSPPCAPSAVIRDQWQLLRLSGFAPHIRGCVHCGETEASRWQYSAPAGGLLCPACGRRGMDLQPGAVKALRQVVSGPADINIRLGPAQQKQIEQMLQAHLEYHAGIQTRTSLFQGKMERFRTAQGQATIKPGNPDTRRDSSQ